MSCKTQHLFRSHKQVTKQILKRLLLCTDLFLTVFFLKHCLKSCMYDTTRYITTPYMKRQMSPTRDQITSLLSTCPLSSFLHGSDQGCIANTRPVATIEKWATGRVMQRLVLARSVGHGEPGFRLRSSVFATPIGKGVCLLFFLFYTVQSIMLSNSRMQCMK